MILAVAAALVAGTTSIAAADQPVNPPVAAGARTAPHAQLLRTGATLHYGVPTPNCPAPTPGDKACLSERIEPATKDTPGAIAYTEPKARTAGPAGGYTPADLASAYGFNPTSPVGATQTVAVVDAYDDPDVLADLNTFDKQYNLHDGAEDGTSFRKVNEQGQTSPLPPEDDGWSGEIALDVEAVRAVCNQCHILLVEASPTTDSDGTTGVKNADFDKAVNTAAAMGATEISNSYGGAEVVGRKTTSSAADLKAYNHPGIVITAASGDDGWYDWDWANDGSTSDNSAEAPASYPTVVAVGGTTLSLNAAGARSAEAVWNEDGRDDGNGLVKDQAGNVFWYGAQGASGGGCSLLYAAPAFQAAVAGYTSLGCGSKRSTNDISALADPAHGFDVYDSSYSAPSNAPHPGSHWATVGGTSLASPLIAAMWALAGGANHVAYPAEDLYDHLRETPSTLYDVTSGGNGFCGGDKARSCAEHLFAVTGGDASNPNGIGAGLLDCGFTAAGAIFANNHQCNAARGYDGPSGVGTPRGLAAFRPVAPTAIVDWPTPVRPGVAATFRIDRADPVMTSADTYTWTWGDGTTTTTKAASVVHRYARAGTYPVTLRVADQFGHTGAPIAKSYVIGQAPAVKVKGPKKAHPHKRVTFKAIATDPNTGGRITRYTWRVGHKVVGHGKKLKYRFPKTGKTKVRVTVTDSSGLSAKSAAHKVRVR